MKMNLINLDSTSVRKLMLDEFNGDLKEGKVYLSIRLMDDCKDTYTNLMIEAIKNGNDQTLAEDLVKNNCLKSIMPRRTRNGVIMVRVPSDAHQTLAQGEFNRFYLRAVCILAAENGTKVEAYRAKFVTNPRPHSEALIGTIMDPNELLNDLRTNIGEEPSLKMPGGPNSGISVKLIQDEVEKINALQ